MWPLTVRSTLVPAALLSSGDSIGYFKGLVAGLDPGRYAVDEIRGEPGPSGPISRRWGVLLKLEDDSIVTEPDPWEP
jgi:hypothetical protein